MADKNLGTTYIEIGASTDKLKAGLQTAKTTTEQTVRGMETEVQKLPAAFNKASGGANNMNMAIGQLGYALGDSSMFMFSFRAGMMSIGNNIPVIVQGLMQAKVAAEASGSSFKSALASSIMGPGGALLAVNALMFALQVLPQLLSDTQSKADKFDLDTLANETDDFAKAMKELNKQVKDLATDELDSYLSKLTSRLEETRDKLAEFTNQMSNLTLVSALVGIDLTKLFGDSKYKDFVEKITAITKAIKGIDEQKKDPGIIGRLDADIKSLNEQLESAKTVSEINKINTSLKSLKDHRDALLGKESKKGKGSETDIQKILKEEQTYKDELAKTNEALKQTNISEFTRNELLAKRADLLEQIHKWDRVNAAGKAGLGDVQGLTGFDNMGRRNKDGIYIPDTTMPSIDSEKVRKQKEQSDAGWKSSMKDFEQYQSTAEDFANTLSNGFANAIMGGQNLGQVFSNLAVQLGAMVIQAVAFKAIMMAFGFDTGGASGLMGAIGSAFGFNPTVSIPAGGSNSAPIQQGLGQISTSLSGVQMAVSTLNNNLIDASAKGRKDTLNIGIQGKLDGDDIYLSNKQAARVRGRYR